MVGATGLSPARETILLSESLSDLQVQPRRDVVDTFSISGGRSRELLRPWIDVRIVLDRFNDRKLFRKFSAMINHLERGGPITFGNDSSKAFLSYTTGRAVQGTSILSLAKQVYVSPTSYAPATLDAGDEIVIESGPPAGKREYHIVSTHSVDGDGSKLTLGDSLDLFDDYPRGSVVRHSDLFPVLIMGPGQVGAASLTHDHRITYTLDILLSMIHPHPESDTVPQGGGSKTHTDK